MTDIEKRAYVHYPIHSDKEMEEEYIKPSRNAYIKIASEQKTIDIKNVREWVNDNKQPVLASDTDDTIVGYSIAVEEFIEWLKTMEE